MPTLFCHPEHGEGSAAKAQNMRYFTSSGMIINSFGRKLFKASPSERN